MRCTRYKIVAIILATIAVGLLIGSFFMPPQGKIDGSVLSGVGEIIGIIAIFFAWEAVDKGIDAKVTHGNTTIELNNPDKKDE
jgi:hypothetical protein